MKEFTVFAATANSDSQEGKGYDIDIALFSNRADAFLAAKGRGPMGTAGEIRLRKIKIFENYQEFRLSEDKEAKKRALAKLTEEDKAALGF